MDKLIQRGLIQTKSLESLPEVDFAIYSSAIRKSENPYYLHFQNRGTPLLHRSEIMHRFFSEISSISVAGSHGKTSTTAMISEVLLKMNLDPGIMIGGDFPLLNGAGGRWGKGKWGVYESDESDGTFLNHQAEIKILTNIDNDHLDFYKSQSELEKAFLTYLNPKENGLSIACLDDPGIEAISTILDKTKPYLFYSNRHSSSENTIAYKIENHEIQFELDQSIYKLKLPIPGDHFLKNAIAAILALRAIGIHPKDSVSILTNFSGVGRRLELLGERSGIRIFDDYGHHPTEIRAVIQSIKGIIGSGKCIVLFQPHRFTRTRDHFHEFSTALSLSDYLFLLPIYPAGEDPIENINSEMIFKNISCPGSLLSGEIQNDCKAIRSVMNSGDVIVSLGAGNVRDWAINLLNED